MSLPAAGIRNPDDLPPIFETPTIATYAAEELDGTTLRVNAGSDTPFG